MRYVFEKQQLCSGCGNCAANCKAISMTENETGVYRPRVDKELCVSCGKCVALCPMLQKSSVNAFRLLTEEPSKMQYSPTAGSYLACYEGFVEKRRKDSASGGFCTLLLERLLSEHEVEAVCCVGHKNDAGELYEYRYITTVEELYRCSKSAYYPVHLEKILQEIRAGEQKVAITALPCAAKAIRLAMQRDSKLAKNIKYIIGLICGGLPGKGMVNYIAAKGGILPEEITGVSFRDKEPEYKCNNVGIRIESEQKQITSHFHGEDFGFAYLNNLFHNPSCFCCTDIFAEYADIVFGDSWLPENKENILGTSVCLVRNTRLNQIMQSLDMDTMKAISIERCIKTQSSIGLVEKKKRRSLAFRKIMAGQYEMPELKKDGMKKEGFRSFTDYCQASAKLHVNKLSKKKWAEVRAGKCSVDDYEAYMKQRLTALKKLRLIR